MKVSKRALGVTLAFVAGATTAAVGCSSQGPSEAGQTEQGLAADESATACGRLDEPCCQGVECTQKDTACDPLVAKCVDVLADADVTQCGKSYHICCLGECNDENFCDDNFCWPRPDAGTGCGGAFQTCCSGFTCKAGFNCDPPPNDICLPNIDAGAFDAGSKDAGACGKLGERCCDGFKCAPRTHCNTLEDKCVANP